ncbi:MAG: hypothetical protein ACK50Y_00270 [Flavobacteriia bacterium]|jgi:hypothetical protein
MKNLFVYLCLLFFGGLLFTSCSEEIDMIDGFEETAVIYGLLDKSETIHFIKINRAFIGPGNSLEIAQIPDSSYFDQVDATVTEFVNGSQTRQWTLQDTTIENKDTEGVFYAPTQKLYYFSTASSSPLTANATYKLHVSLNNGEFEVDGETELVSGISTSADGQSFRYTFADDPGSYTQKGISVLVGNSHVVNATLRINYEEIESGVDTVARSFDWKLGESEVSPNGSKTFTMNGKSFYDLMKVDCNTSDPTINTRRLKSIKAIITGGAEEFYNYMTVNKPTSTLAQSKPTYTNLKVSAGHRVIGIFSSRLTYSTEKFYINPSNTSLRMLDTKSTIELCTGPVTGNLFFCSQHPADNGLNYSCQ